VGISDGQWNVLQARRARDTEAITANDSGIVVAAGKVLYGIDAAGCRHLLVPVTSRDVEEDHDSQGVQVGVRTLTDQGTPTLYADLVCLKPRFNNEFAHVVADVLDALANGAAPHSVCRRSLEKWRDLLRAAQSTRLDDSGAAGLFGELLLLLDLVKISRAATRLWTGPSGARFDFTGSTLAIEVKTTTRRYGRLVEINGETQLQAPPGLALHLNFVRLEAVPAGGSRLWDLYSEILRLGAPAVDMRRALSGLALDEASLENDQKAFRVLESRLYRVDDRFPKIVPASFVGAALPSGTLRLRYTIDISAEPPLPLDAQAREARLNSLLLERDGA
jgi:hypothetical protein